MKKILITIALIATAAFSANSQIRVEALGNFARINFNDGDQIAKAGFGYGARAFYNIGIREDTGFQIGLGYMATNSTNDATNATLSLQELQLPFHYLGKWDLNNLTITCCAGLYLGYYLDGTTTFDISVAKTSANPFEGDGGLKRYTFGSDDELIASFGNFGLGVGYQYNFTNLCKDSDVKIRRGNAYVVLSYAF